MSVLNLSGDEAPECPLCMEFLELDDINFYPCSCLYQICRFCWNKLRTEGNGLCPACRQPYTENPADFKPLTTEEMAKIKAEKRQKDQAKKQKITENRKHLSNVRVVQKNLVFVVGLSPRLADPEVLKKPDYFGKFGKIHKVVINHSTQYAGSQLQGPSASAYVTYLRSEDALRAIQAVNNIYIDGRTLKASLGTTKYCSHFMKNQSCPKNDCMYLHELGDEQASFTKEQMQQGKHTEYEKALHEEMLASLAQQPPVSPSPDSLGGGGADTGDWAAVSHWGSTPPRPTDHWGGGSDSAEWGSGGGHSGGGDGAWPDLGNYGGKNQRGQFISNNSKEESAAQDKSKSKSCSSSDCDSTSLPADPSGDPSDQVVPGGGQEHHYRHHSGLRVGLADAAWDDTADTSSAQPAAALSSQSTETSVTEPEPEPRHDSGWLDNDLKSSTAFLDDDTDDLGFDPFHETQKGLADLLESEAAAQAQHQAKVSSPSPDWRGPVSGPPGPGPARVKLPPPGFHTNSAAPHQLPHTNLGYGGQGGYGAGPGLNLPPVSSNAVDSLFGLGPGPVRQRSGGPAPGFGGHAPQGAGQELLFGLGGGAKAGAGLDLGGPNRLGLGGLGGLGDRLFDQKQNHLGPHLQDNNGFANKDWQDGLRALLPNVNVSFGVGGSGGNVGNPGAGAGQGHFGLGGMHQQQQSAFSQQQDRQQTLQHNTNWGSGLPNGLGNDWTMLDPAIVTGQLSNSLDQAQPGHGAQPHTSHTADSPPSWITANLEQLTAEPGSSGSQFSSQGQSNLIPAFTGLGLGGRVWPATTATPPPGFSHHRQLPHHHTAAAHYQPGFAGVSKGSEAHKIGEF